MNELRPDEKWYFKTPILILAFLCIGPFMLPLVWFNPRLDVKNKVVISIITVIVTIILSAILVRSLGSIAEYYNILKQSL